MSSVYEINRAIGKPIVFKGLKAQWIWWLGGGLLFLLLLFAAMYIVGVPVIVCFLIIGALGVVLFWWPYAMSRQYGEHGWMKKTAARSIPKGLKGCSRMSVEKNLCDANSERSVTHLGSGK